MAPKMALTQAGAVRVAGSGTLLQQMAVDLTTIGALFMPFHVGFNPYSPAVRSDKAHALASLLEACSSPGSASVLVRHGCTRI